MSGEDDEAVQAIVDDIMDKTSGTEDIEQPTQASNFTSNEQQQQNATTQKLQQQRVEAVQRQHLPKNETESASPSLANPLSVCSGSRRSTSADSERSLRLEIAESSGGGTSGAESPLAMPILDKSGCVTPTNATYRGAPNTNGVIGNVQPNCEDKTPIANPTEDMANKAKDGGGGHIAEDDVQKEQPNPMAEKGTVPTVVESNSVKAHDGEAIAIAPGEPTDSVAPMAPPSAATSPAPPKLTIFTYHVNYIYLHFLIFAFLSVLLLIKSEKMFKGDEVIFQKKRRFRYTCLEERKMWHFFVRELKAQNPDALRKRITLWEMYEGEERTTKKMFGLESHFRKYMLPRINHAAVPREDLFLLLRFFRAHLTTAQRKELEHLHDCEIECERNGIFLRARIENKAGEFFFPTQEQESTILRPLDDEDQSEGAKTEEEQEDSVVAESVYGDDEDIDEEEREGTENHPPRRQTPSIERNGTTKSNGPNKASKSNNVDKRKDIVAQNTRSGWISKALLSRPPLSRPPKRKRNNRDTTTVIVLEQDNAADKGQEQNKSGNGQEKNNIGSGQEQGNNAAKRQEHKRRDTTADVLGSGNASPLARSTPQPMDQENEQSCSNRLSSLLPQLVSPVEQPDNATKVLRQSTSRHVVDKTNAINTAKMKRHFLAGSLKLLDSKMNYDAFVRPFTGGKFEKGVRSIAWFVEKA